MLDVVIRGGDVVDGTGRSRYRADLGVLDGRIVEIGEVSSSSRRTVDAGGRIVAPGFIDVHTHYDVQAFWDPCLSPSALHGVTTVLGGNCGFTVAPLDSESAEYLMRTLARVEGMPLATLATAVPWDWKTTGEYLDRLDGTLALNAGFMVGHTAIRRVVMGPDATTRTSTPEELSQMIELLRDGLRAGGIGFSTSRGRAHQDANGDPVPSRFASPEEIVALAAVCQEFPGTSLEFIPHHRPFTDEDKELAIAMTVAAQRPLNWNILNANATTITTDLSMLEVSDAAAARGGKIVALVLPMEFPGRLSFASGFILDSIDGWSKDMVKSTANKLATLRNPAERARLKASAQTDPDRAELVDWGNKLITETGDPSLRHYVGRRVDDIAAEEGKDPFDALLDIVCSDQLQTTFSRFTHESAEDWEARRRVWRDNRTLFGASDAGAHVDYFATFQYPTAFLASGMREHRIFNLEEAVASLTADPADLYGLRDRGRLVNGAKADIVIFDEERIAPGPTVTRRDLPGGAASFYSAGIGIDEVMVNGQTIVVTGEYTDARPGTLLRGGKDTRHRRCNSAWHQSSNYGIGDAQISS